jgi:uncharacterized Zn finger protein
MRDDWGWRDYVPVAQRRLAALRKVEQLKNKGRSISPVTIVGRTIANTFWGKAWCENLERYSDFRNRLPRGRTYVRNGSVIDLQIAAGQVRALVSGSDIYEIVVKIKPVGKSRWKAICKDCSGRIDSVVELLQGRFSSAVMERICREKTGLFPAPDEIDLSCSCPDWASMCKHVAAVLYAVGVRLDQQPELLFRLHELDEEELISKAGSSLPLSKKLAAEKLLQGSDLGELFGVEMASHLGSPTAMPAVKAKAAKRGKRLKKLKTTGR